MKLPALSPDLNPIENVWRVLAREVYKEGKQYITLFLSSNRPLLKNGINCP
jgi:transposase